MLETVLAHPVSLGILTGLIGILTFAYQAHRKQLDEQLERRRKLYESLIENVFRLLDAKPGHESSAVMTEIEKSWLFATDDVLRACYKVFEAYEGDAASTKARPSAPIRSDEDARSKFGTAVALLFVAMRKDLRGRRSKINEEWARRVVKVYESGAPYEDSRTTG